MKVIKAIARAAQMAKVNNFDDYQFYKLEPEESDNIYLNEEEIARIAKVNLSRHRHLEETRDMFVVACWVGCRFGDFNKITPQNIKNNLIYFKQSKTKGRFIIPLNPVVKSIIDKYCGKLPKPKLNQHFNRDLKPIAKAANLRQKETKGITKG